MRVPLRLPRGPARFNGFYYYRIIEPIKIYNKLNKVPFGGSFKEPFHGFYNKGTIASYGLCLLGLSCSFRGVLLRPILKVGLRA